MTEEEKKRAEDRGRPLGLEAFEQPLANGNFLGDPVVVEGLVRSFMIAVVDIRAKWDASDEDGDSALEKCATLVKDYARIFYGKDGAYIAQPWNSPEQLGKHIAARFEVADKDPVEAYLWHLMNRILEIATALAGEELTDDAAHFQVDAEAEEAFHLFLGIPITLKA